MGEVSEKRTLLAVRGSVLNGRSFVRQWMPFRGLPRDTNTTCCKHLLCCRHVTIQIRDTNRPCTFENWLINFAQCDQGCVDNRVGSLEHGQVDIQGFNPKLL